MTNHCYWADVWLYFIFDFGSNIINNELKRLEQLLLLTHADTRFTSAVETEQPEVVPLYIC